MDIDQHKWAYQLHERLLNGDVTASAEIAEQFLFGVVRQLRRRYPHLEDQHLVDTAVHEAFMRYFQHPERYNPAKSSLTHYLLMSAEGDLRNMLNSRESTPQLRIDTFNGDEDKGTIVVADDFDLEAEVLNGLSPGNPAPYELLTNFWTSPHRMQISLDLIRWYVLLLPRGSGFHQVR